ncbi:peptide/nickel transport system substrate-binding protein [Lampropedia hyalina DSM 16112]|jgi:peptide/nickel transport system substrate-binding protein|uniref:Peptide/nickel transport system substrate-binding protein n=1 Tax=Lampropedia hyalina DSM 16112 TaxID=1122156 RepID=A0A1M4SI61_9BURK|nr:ABC transporter substrate-binding protein [Lampropedia hyalina]SHE31901.1 peptide/nickel transport system substrate-binding protein [Lampropedia hyalina DSM 16112]
MQRRSLLKWSQAWVLAGAGWSLALGAAQAQTVGSQPVQGGVLNVAIAPEPTQLSSANLTTMNVGMVSSKILEGLVSYDLNLQPQPALATSWETAADGKTLTFHLREGVKWHDGKDFSSADVAWTLEEVWKKLHPFGRAAFANVEKVETPNAHQVVIHLSSPAPYILNYINTYGAQILPRHIYEGKDVLTHPANNAPIGTGPFVFKEWVKGSHIRLERNPHYWGKGADGSPQPYLDGLLFRFIPDAAARTVAIEAGEIDVALGSIVPLTNLNRFKDEKKFTINLTDGNYLSTIFLLQFNVRKPHFQDVRVRQAFAHAIDKQALLRIVFQNYGKVATGPVPSSVVNYYSNEVRSYPLDLQRAAALLDEAGFRKGADGKRLKVTLDVDGFGGVIGPRSGEFIKQSLAKVDVDVELRTNDTAAYLKRIFTDADYDLMTSSLHRLPDPTLGVQRLYWTQNIRPGVPWTNGSGYSNPALDKVMEAAGVEPDDAKRKALIKEWQQIVQEEVPLIELIEQTWVTVSTARLKKLALQGDGLFDSYADAWLEPAK